MIKYIKEVNFLAKTIVLTFIIWYVGVLTFCGVMIGEIFMKSFFWLDLDRIRYRVFLDWDGRSLE